MCADFNAVMPKAKGNFKLKTKKFEFFLGCKKFLRIDPGKHCMLAECYHKRTHLNYLVMTATHVTGNALFTVTMFKVNNLT